MAQYIERAKANESLIYNTRLKGIDLEEAVNAICSVPAADVAPVRHGYDTRASRYFHCSVCDYGVADVYEDGPTLVFERQKEWNYCPNCGAKMDGET